MSEANWQQKCFYRVSIKAVIFDEQGKVLVVREKNNPNWNLPGGGMDYGENEYDALKRELYEEVGFNDDFTYKPLGTHSKYLDGKKAWLLWIVYKVAPAILDFKVGDEADEIAFMDPEEFKKSKPHIYVFCKQAQESPAL
jgi:8-oxo-dGTP pyrophosphatase MutT (NUDIX family)